MRMSKFSFFISVFTCCFACGQHSDTVQPVLTVTNIAVGDSNVTLINSIHPKALPYLLLNVHENESTSLKAAHKLAEKFPVNISFLNQLGKRRLYFNADSVVYSVDPNRIFTSAGISYTLKLDTVPRQLKELVSKVVTPIQALVSEYKFIVSLHNNTPRNYSILSYLPGGNEAANTDSVFVNKRKDADDFFYTTEAGIYQKIKEAGFNVILQHKDNCVDDGSLSVYCARQKIAYVNVEAEEGHLSEQTEMLLFLHQLLSGML